jgi:prepilin-type N-terminal cleavage/methylation domain-containing protein
MRRCRRVSNADHRTQRGFTLLETLVAAVVFTGVFLVIFSLQGKVMMGLSGSDAIRVSQLADQTLAAFLDRGQIPSADTTMLVDGIKYRLTCKTETDSELTKLWLIAVREITGDTIGTFYTERFAQTAQ